MPSNSLRHWQDVCCIRLDEIVEAHRAVGGTGRGRRYATEQVNHAYAVLLAAQFQGFCRDLHSECVAYLASVVATHPALRDVLQDEFNLGRQLDRGNAQSGSLGADFGRLGIDFWPELEAYDP